MKNRWNVYSIFALSLVIIIGAGLTVFGEEGPRYGGTLRVALTDEPGTLDMQMSTSVTASVPARHILEGLFAFDANYTPQPMLVRDWSLDATGTIATFYLRRGILFHNGEEMKAEDVVASLVRWGEYGLIAAALWELVVDLVAVDDHTVQMTLDEPFGPMLTFLANIYGGPRIFPKEIVEAAGGQPIAPDKIIGTGPYKFVAWEAGDYILLERFDGYRSLPIPASGFAGRRVAYFDRLQFFFVPEAGARLIGVKAGTFDYAMDIPTDLFPLIEDVPQVRPILTNNPPIFPVVLINTKQGVTASATLRRALLAALDIEAIMLAGYGDPKFWSLNPSFFSPGTRWYTEEAGGDLYNANDPARARELAAYAGYDYEPIRIIVAEPMAAQFSQAIVVTDQLRRAGFNVDLRVFDMATYFAVRNDRDNPEWELAFTFFITTPDPALVLTLNPYYAGWWDTPEIRALRVEVNRLIDFDERHAKWVEIMDLWYEQVPTIKLGDAYHLHLIRAEIGGGYGTPEVPPMLSPFFWNAWRK